MRAPMDTALLASAACIAAVAGLLVAERRGAAFARAVCKTAASAGFVAVALALGATGSAWGRWMLAALLLGALGDVLLLGRQARAFAAGLAVFLLSHLCFAFAFWHGGVMAGVAVGAAVVAAAAGAAIARWLGPHLARAWRLPVGAYVVAILGMCALAVGFGAAHGGVLVPAGALLFALSDVAVARERFVAPGFANRAWGLPAYYVAQLSLAWSVAAPP